MFANSLVKARGHGGKGFPIEVWSMSNCYQGTIDPYSVKNNRANILRKFILTFFFPMFPFDPPEDRKPFFF